MSTPLVFRATDAAANAVNSNTVNLTVTAAGDPYWAGVLMLLNGSDVITKDSSSFNRALSTGGTPTYNAGITIFGVRTYDIQPSPAASSYIETVSTDSFVGTAMGSGEWCIEIAAIFNAASVGGSNSLNSFSKFTMGRILATNKITVNCSDIGGSSVVLTSTNTFATGTLHQIAFVRDNVTDPTFTILRLFVNGVQEASSGGISKAAIIGTSAGDKRFIGYISAGWVGNFNNFRLTVGNARYRANYTPPSTPFPTS